MTFLKGDYKKMYPDYISAINRLDYNVGRLVDKLKELGIYDDTIIVYTSDHGSHFKTRNPEYKRSCHESATHTPLIIKGGKFTGGKKKKDYHRLLTCRLLFFPWQEYRFQAHIWVLTWLNKLIIPIKSVTVYLCKSAKHQIHAQ